MKVEKSVIFVKKKLKTNMWKIKKYCKVRNNSHYTGGNRGAAQNICNLNYSVPKKIPIALHNEHDNEKCETCATKYKNCGCSLEYTNFMNVSIDYKCLCCNKNYQQMFDEKLNERFLNTYKFSSRDNNKFILFLRKGVFLYEYIHDWGKFSETSLPEKEQKYGKYYWCRLRAHKQSL